MACASCRPNTETPPVPCSSTVWPAIILPCSIMACHTVTPAQGKRRALLEREVRGDFHRALLLQHDVFRQHAVDAAAERGRLHVGRRLAARPALEEVAGDLVADLDAGDAGADLDHFAGAVRQRNDVVAHRHAVGAAHDAEIAEVERAGRDLDQHLAMAGRRLRPLDLGQRVDAGAALGQLIGTHVLLPTSCSRNSFDHFP